MYKRPKEKSNQTKSFRRLWWEQLESRQLLASIELLPVADNTLYESATGNLSNGAGQHLFVGRTNQGSLRRGLLRFEVGSEIPTGSTINSVSLQLHVSRVRGGVDTVGLHAVMASWGEGSSDAPGQEGGGTAASTSDATWLHRSFDSTLWSEAGGDFNATASGSAQVGGVGDYVWSSPGMIEDVESWLDDPATEVGWLLKGAESSNGSTHRFDSRENSTIAFRPRLTIDFTPPDTNDAPTDIVLDGTSIAENTDTSGPVIVGDLEAIDADSNDSHSFTLATGAGDTDNASFQVTGTQLQFVAGTNLDHEAKGTYSVRLRATDAGGLHVEKSFGITVTNVNEPPTDITLSSPIVPHLSPGASIGQLAALDPEVSDTHTFVVSDSRFEVVDGLLKLKDAVSVDGSSESTIEIDITATDSGTPAANASKSFALTVASALARFQNPLDANDVNADGFVSPIDALVVINFLNEEAGNLPAILENPPRFLDVSGDNQASPIDALIVINVLNDDMPSAEGESAFRGIGVPDVRDEVERKFRAPSTATAGWRIAWEWSSQGPASFSDTLLQPDWRFELPGLHRQNGTGDQRQ